MTSVDSPTVGLPDANELVAKALWIRLTQYLPTNSEDRASRRLHLTTFSPDVVRSLVGRLSSGAVSTQVLVKVDPFYRPFMTDFHADYFLDQEAEKLTGYRNGKHPNGQDIIQPLVLFITSGEWSAGEAESILYQVETIDGVQLRDQPGELIDCLPDIERRLTEQHRDALSTFIYAISQVAMVSLEDLAAYVLEIYRLCLTGCLLVDAWGMATYHLGGFAYKDAFHNLKADKIERSKWLQQVRKVVPKLQAAFEKRESQGLPISAQVLLENYDRALGQRSYTVEQDRLIRGFIAAAPGDTVLLEVRRLDWEHDGIRVLFEQKRQKAMRLGEQTITHLELEEGREIATAERDLMLAVDQSSEPVEQRHGELVSFVENWRGFLSKKLLSKWEELLFPAEIRASDFLDGFLRCIENLLVSADKSHQYPLYVNVTLRGHDKPKSFAARYSLQAASYFIYRYRGLAQLLPSVRFELGPLADLSILEQYRGKDDQVTEFYQAERMSRSANQFQFDIRLFGSSETDLDREELGQRTLVWEFPAKSILAGFARDIEILKNLATPCRCSYVSREVTSSKGTTTPLSLEDTKWLAPVKNRDRGQLISTDENSFRDLKADYLAGLHDCAGFLDDDLATKLPTTIDAFEHAYQNALTQFAQVGLAADAAVADMALMYSRLLSETRAALTGRVAVAKLLCPVLQIGMVYVRGIEGTAIVAPHHPLRLYAIWIKAKQLATRIEAALTEPLNFIDKKLFFGDLAQLVSHPFFPEIGVLTAGDGQVTLGSSKAEYGDYSLFFSAQTDGQAANLQDDDPRQAVNALVKAVKRYLELHPHHKSSMSIVLHSIESARFPHLAVDQLSRGNDPVIRDSRCRVILRDVNPRRLRDTYASFLVASNGPNGSTMDDDNPLMGRLRIEVMTDPTKHFGGAVSVDPDLDMSFLLDHISRQAQVALVSDSCVDFPDALEHNPTLYTRRRPLRAMDDLSSVYLCSPQNPHAVALYNDAVCRATLSAADRDASVYHLPAREIQFSQNNIKRVLHEAHRLTRWVVSLDDMLDRRQLRRNNIRVIRYRQGRNLDRNLTISTTAEMRHLYTGLEKKLRPLIKAEHAPQLQSAMERIVDDANQVSGEVVLKAAGRGHFANELIGVALSRYLVEQELSDSERARAIWIYLDDYADWFVSKQLDREAQLLDSGDKIADLLCLVPGHSDEGVPLLRVIVVESKFIGSPELAAAQKRSARQLNETHQRLLKVFGNESYEDKSHWWARFADLIVEGGEVHSQQQLDLEAFATALRGGHTVVDLQSYSHVFVHTEASAVSPSRRPMLNGRAEQWVIPRKETSGLLAAYLFGANAGDLRAQLVELPIEDPLPETRSPAYRSLQSDRPGDTSAARATGGAALPQEPTPTVSHPPTVPEILGDTPAVDPEESTRSAQAFAWAPPRLGSLLSEMAREANPQLRDDDERNAVRLVEEKVKRILASRNIRVDFGPTLVTPNSYRVQVKGQLGLQLKHFEKSKDDLLTVEGLHLDRVEPIPGHFALSVRKPERSTVYYLDCLKDRTVRDPGVNSRILLGRREEDGDLVYYDLDSEDPHALIGGMTKSGKSQLLIAMILDLAMTNDPSRLRLTLVDPKQVEFQRFEQLPHLEGEILIDETAALERLHALVSEMERRYELLRINKVNSIDRYNQKNPDTPLPRHVMIFDEFADWMLDDDFKREAATAVKRLAGKARAAGIHLIVATQRPDATVVPPILRANLGAKIALRVDTEANSQIILNERGAETLLGAGHILAKFGGQKVYLQGAYIDEDKADRIIHFLVHERMS